MANYYDVLGVDSGADHNTIRSAYRSRIKECHPDVSRKKGAVDEFRRVREAFETLGDPQRRAEYDRELERPADPWSRGRRSSPWGAEPFEEVWSRDPREDFLDEFFAAFGRGWTGPEWFGRGTGRRGWRRDTRAGNGGRYASDAGLELRMSAMEAETGGRVRFSLNERERCPHCADFQGDPMMCAICGGTGVVDREHSFVLDVPEGVRDGEVLTAYPTDPSLESVQVQISVTGRAPF